MLRKPLDQSHSVPSMPVHDADVVAVIDEDVGEFPGSVLPVFVFLAQQSILRRCRHAAGLPRSKDLDNPEVFAPSLHKAQGESTLHFIKRVLTEGHTVPDAFLTVAAAQIGWVCRRCQP